MNIRTKSSMGIAVMAAGQATGLFLAVTFTLCVLFDLIFPKEAMYHVWIDLLPGFHWINGWSFLFGLVESYAYGWFIALIWVPLYNIFLLGRVRRNEHL